jgi:hypothetical protein
VLHLLNVLNVERELRPIIDSVSLQHDGIGGLLCVAVFAATDTRQGNVVKQKAAMLSPC